MDKCVILFDIHKKDWQETVYMRRKLDDFSEWRRQQENQANPFPYVYPQMPPRFRRCYRFSRTLFLIEWGSSLLFAFGGVVAFVLMLFRAAGGQCSFCFDCCAVLYTPAFMVSLQVVTKHAKVFLALSMLRTAFSVLCTATVTGNG